jgi:hypothetical protein
MRSNTTHQKRELAGLVIARQFASTDRNGRPVGKPASGEPFDKYYGSRTRWNASKPRTLDHSKENASKGSRKALTEPKLLFGRGGGWVERHGPAGGLCCWSRVVCCRGGKLLDSCGTDALRFGEETNACMKQTV